MLIKYAFNGVEYQDETSVRQAIYKATGKAFGVEPQSNRQEFWQSFGVSYKEEADPEPTETERMETLRRYRDYLLNESDYYVMPDYPSTEEGLVAVKEYRQALRDITETEGFPNDVTWPAKPSVLK